MKNIGLIGGVGWPSTIDYYRIINEAANQQAGNLRSPNIIIYSLNFEPIKKLHLAGKWDKTVPILKNAAQNLEKAGADFILICSGTTNIPYKKIQQNIAVPILDIVTPTALEIKKRGFTKAGLIGTKPTMEHSFFRNSLKEHGIEALVPERKDRELIHRVIYEELCLNIIRKESKKEYLRIVDSLIKRSAQAIILGCTEIPMLISEKDISIPVFDIAKLHALDGLKKSLD